MRLFSKLALLVLMLQAVAMPLAAQTDVPAFPGAEGFGRYTTGGRGGKVLYVTTLEDNAPDEPIIKGSLRWAIREKGARTILFSLSGTIHLKQELKIYKNGDLTIAGQSAPGDGICVADYPVVIASDNVIIRYMRFRLGDKGKVSDGADALGSRDYKNIIIDHCSMSWSIDECCSLFGTENLTVQWCIISESLRMSGHSKGTHGYGGNWGGANASYHHNLLAHHDSRCPRLGPAVETQTREWMDLRNNVFYNWRGNGCYGGEGMKVNIVNNYYKPGPATDEAKEHIKYRICAIDIRTSEYSKRFPKFAVMENVWGKFYIDGNVMDRNPEVTADNWTKGVYQQINKKYNISQTTKDTIRLSEPLDAGYVTTHTAEKAYAQVLKFAGRYPHDAVDRRVVSDTRLRAVTCTGSKSNIPGFIDSPDDTRPESAPADWSPFPVLKSAPAPLDTDGDGIPDEFEDMYGLDKNNPADGNQKNNEGYTNLEFYLNMLVMPITQAQNAGGKMVRPCR